MSDDALRVLALAYKIIDNENVDIRFFRKGFNIYWS